MSITPEQKAIVQATFAEAAQNADVVAATFYARLFEIAPSVRPMFRGDMTEQGKKLMSILQVAVHSLDNLESIIPAVQALGQRHVAYGVKEEHYEVVGRALLWTLAHAFGERFTPEVEAAWRAVYNTLASVAIGDNYTKAA
jgi:nitric oxide dioxygenase